jgi:hypothetical protein
MTMTGASARFGLVLILLAGCQQGAAAPANTALTPATHKFPIVSGPHAADCNTCHGDFQSFSQFTCLNCHGHEKPLTDMLHVSLARRGSAAVPDGGVGYAYDGVSCLQCHATGGRVPYDHAGITVSCASCHDTGTPFVALPVAGAGLDGGVFTHPPKGGNDCRACHTTTSWLGAGRAPGGIAFDPAQDVQVDALIPSYVGTSISSLSPQTETLHMEMNHQTTDLATATLSNCASCHENAGSGEYFPGLLHSSLANTVPPIAQPGQCMDCHLGSMPLGFVGPTATSPARTPASGEMKHDAVVWNGAGPTATTAVAYDCAVCHMSPSQALVATWATNQSGTSPALFHASLTAAALPQPASCIDCHANSRPDSQLTSANASMPANLTFDHGTGPALADCVSCHTGSATQWTSWSKGRFHLAGSSTPTTCLPCHAGERPATTAGWLSTTYQGSPFDYGTNASGITHGDGQDCVSCHRNPGTGSWGGTQNWARGSFTHGPATLSGTTCVACHTTQRPAAVVSGFDHSLNGTGDCLGCHQATVAAGTYLNYNNPSTGTLPGGDWKGAVGYPGSTLVGSPNQFVTVTELTLNRSGSNNLVTGTSSISATLYNMMLHDSTAVPAALNPGATGSPDYTKCWHCHTNSAGTVTSYADGKFHASLTNYSATPGGTVTPLPQPTSRCSDCHSQMRPAGIVMKSGSDLQPMDHNAFFTSGASAAAMDCSTCHRNPGITWADGLPAQAPLFHANIGAAVPQDCTVCHYPLMADVPKSDLTSGLLYSMRHGSGQITFQSCQTCHTAALSKARNTPAASTLWQGGAYHPALSSQPRVCIDCHATSEPVANASTQSSWGYTLAMGSTSTNQLQWMNHGSSSVAGKDCFLCHASDAKVSGSAWSKADYFHAAVTAPVSCKECHGLTNGGGSVAGTKNNLPSGLTNSSVLTSASGDATTGIPAGTHDQITHTDVNVSARDCNFCHTQAGVSTAAGVQGQEWAQAKLHVKFTSANPLVMNGTTGRCSSCHMNVKPGPGYTAFNHGALSATSGTQDCSSCHSWPGTGTASSPNWLGAGASPQYISVGGFTIPQPPAASPTIQPGINNLPHPAVNGVACTACHTNPSGGRSAIGYDHLSTLINTNCRSCHEAGTNLIGTVWNGATAQASGAGDSRPFTLTSVSNSENSRYPNHFYPADCYQCHLIPAGNGGVTTGTAYKAAWKFPHTRSKMTNPTTCVMCHTNGIPN